MRPSVIVSREDWSQHRKGYQDQARHQQKIREAIKQKLPVLKSELQRRFGAWLWVKGMVKVRSETRWA